MDPCARQQNLDVGPIPREAHAALGRGKELARRRLWWAARAHFQRAAELSPGLAEAHFFMGLSDRNMGHLDSAMKQYIAALQQDPGMYEAAGNLGSVLLRKGRYGEAEDVFGLLARQYPAEVDFHCNLASAMQAGGKPQQAAELLEPLVADSSANVHALAALGNVLVDLGELDRAIELQHRAVALAPDSYQINFNLSQALLLAGRFDEGWERFQWRLMDPRRAGHLYEDPRRFIEPPWDGRSRGTLLLLGEEGLGDSIMFVRYAALAAARSNRVLVECQAGLQRLLSHAPGVAQALARGAPLPLEEMDQYSPLMSLPRLLSAIPHRVPYLMAEEPLVRRWGEAVPGGGRSLNVGICWHGSDSYPNNNRRSIPLGALRPLVGLPGLRLFNLQRGPGLAQLRDLPERAFARLPCELDDGPDAFVDTAALMQSLDLVITCDTSIAHLAGALARPVWLLLCTTPNWRWMLDREDSPWYPTMRIFRQREQGSWGEVVQQVKQALIPLLPPQGGDRP